MNVKDSNRLLLLNHHVPAMDPLSVTMVEPSLMKMVIVGACVTLIGRATPTVLSLLDFMMLY